MICQRFRPVGTISGNDSMPQCGGRVSRKSTAEIAEGEASMRRIVASKKDVPAVLLIEFVAGLSECLLTASLPETTGSFIRWHPQ